MGGTATVIHYLVLWLLHRGLGLDAVFATTAGYLIAAVFNFVASYRFTFRSRAPWRKAIVRYGIVAGSGLLINTAVFTFCSRFLGWHYVAAQVLATALVLVWNFGLGRVYTFSSSR